MLINDKAMGILRKKARWRIFTKEQMQEMLDRNVLLVLDGIVRYKCKSGFDISTLMNVSDVERETPIEFQEHFFLLMGILDPIKEYADLYLNREHPEMVYLYNFLFQLYYSEVPVTLAKSN